MWREVLLVVLLVVSLCLAALAASLRRAMSGLVVDLTNARDALREVVGRDQKLNRERSAWQAVAMGYPELSLADADSAERARNLVRLGAQEMGICEARFADVKADLRELAARRANLGVTACPCGATTGHEDPNADGWHHTISYNGEPAWQCGGCWANDVDPPEAA